MENEELVRKIAEAKSKYYNNGDSELSDWEYDELEDELRKLDPENPILNQIGTSDLGKSEKIQLKNKMYSTDKALNIGELQTYWNRIGDVRDIIISKKMDGMSIGLYYKDGVLQDAYTRGSGVIGVSKKDRMLYIPAFIPKLGKDFTGYIHGECLLSKSNFNKLNDILVSLGEEKQSNPRNSVAGLINSQNIKGAAKKFALLSFKVFGVYSEDSDEYGDFNTYTEQLEEARNLGFEPVDYMVFDRGKQNFTEDFASKLENWIKEDEHDCDGIVLRVNSNSKTREFGSTEKYLNGVIALKFKPEQAVTKVIRIEYKMGTKEITPVIYIEPVELAGAIIKKVGGHSVKNLIDIGAAPGNKVVITRQGNVIPKCSRYVEEA